MREWAGRKHRDRIEGQRPQAWRIAVLAVVVATHAGIVVVLSLPVPVRPRAMPANPVERIQLLEVPATPAPPVPVRPPGRVERDPTGPVHGSPLRRLREPLAPSVVGPHDGDKVEDGLDPFAGEGRPGGTLPSFMPPPAQGRSMRAPRPRLPGREDAIVEGFHVRGQPSLEDRVLGVSALLFGRPQTETCDDVRQRLIGATPGLAREIDIDRLARLCTD